MKINGVALENELSNRLTGAPYLVTEDLIRHWFIEIHKGACRIEVPYQRNNNPKTPLKIRQNAPKLKTNIYGTVRSRADLYYWGFLEENSRDQEDTVIEFKFHRDTLYSKCCTATNAGEVFNDLNRLSILENKEKYLVYVFDSTMKNYYDKKLACHKHGAQSPMNVFNTTPNVVGNTYTVDANFDNEVASSQEFKKMAFSSFLEQHRFAVFRYRIKMELVNKIGTTGYYLIVAQVL